MKYWYDGTEKRCWLKRLYETFGPQQVTGKYIRTVIHYPNTKVHVANMGPAWVLSSPGGPHVGPMNLAIRVGFLSPEQANIAMTRDESKLVLSERLF